MGACQSCLGQRDKDTYDEHEEDRLLYENDVTMQYGSFAEGHDTIEAQRENEALQQVVAKTSSNMVDIFEIAPQQPNAGASSAGFGYAGQGARVARYQHLVSKLSSEDINPSAGVKIDWFAEDDAPDSQNERPMSLKTLDGDGALVGTFADAAAAMDQ